MKRERVVFDTNVLIGGALSTTSTPAFAPEHGLRNAQLLASTATLHELMENPRPLPLTASAESHRRITTLDANRLRG